nr:MAG TPA: hypothetical protein [Bacteriophage sp.]
MLLTTSNTRHIVIVNKEESARLSLDTAKGFRNGYT